MPYKKEEEEENIVQFKPYTPEVEIESEVSTFKPYTPETPEVEVKAQEEPQVIETGIETPAFTPYFEPYIMQPKQIGDMARIMGTTVEPPKEPVMGLEYIPAKVYSYLVEEPLANAGALVSQGLASGFRALGLDGLADAQDKVTETYKAPPVTESVRKHTAYLREQAYKKGQTEGIVFDISESATRLGSLLVQMGTLGKVPALKGGGVSKRFANLATHGFLTTKGDMKDRLEASVYRAAYSMTPFIAQHWGATGLKSIALDTALNTFLTLPTYVEAYNNAVESGDMSTFISQALPQFVMDIGMALSTRGYPEAQRKVALQNYIKSASNTLGMSYKDLESVIKTFEKAQEPRTKAQKLALEKQEAKLQKLMEKDDANIEFEKLAADEKNAPINKLLEQGKKNPLTPNIQQKVNEAAMSLPTNSQKARVHQLANNLGLITGKGKEKKVYQKYIEGLTGVKSTKDMNQGQIKMIIDNLENLDPATAKTLSKTKVKELTPELIQWLPAIKEVGFVSKFRNPYEVFNELGLLRKVYLPSEKAEVELTEEKMKFKQELNKVANQRGITKDSHWRVFEAIENPDALVDKTIVLNKSEQNYHDFTKRFFDDWANRLNLPPEKRRDRYVTHIFDKTLTDMANKGYIDPDILRAFDFGAIPKSIKNPFIQNQRTGQEFGLKKNPMEAMAAYEDYALKTFHYEPLLKKIDTYAKFLPEASKKYLGNFVGRMTNRPLDIDKGINQDIKGAIDALAKSKAADNPAIKKILPLLQESTRGNIAGAAAYYYTGFMYEAFLGYRPDSAIRNLGQGFLTIAEGGLSNYAKGLAFMSTKEFKDAAQKSTVVRSRQYAYMPEQGGLLPSKVRATAMYMFRTADKFNVLSAFATGYQEAKSLGLPDHIAVERGDEVARKTQFMYTKMATPEVQTSAVGKTLGAFTSWPRNWAELIRHWGRGDIPETYLNYEKRTGKKVYRDDWLSRHQSALRYAVIYALLMYAQSETDIKATEYGGFGTFTSLPRIMSGQLAALKLPVSLAEVIGGTLGQDERMVASGLRGLNPEQYFLAYKRVKEINEGKKDWFDFYIYRDKSKKSIKIK